jgi:hypothetical protein
MPTRTRKHPEAGPTLPVPTVSDLALAALRHVTLADAIREGSLVTTQEHGWGSGENACALSAARLAARARGYLA